MGVSLLRRRIRYKRKSFSAKKIHWLSFISVATGLSNWASKAFYEKLENLFNTLLFTLVTRVAGTRAVIAFKNSCIFERFFLHEYRNL